MEGWVRKQAVLCRWREHAHTMSAAAQEQVSCADNHTWVEALRADCRQGRGSAAQSRASTHKFRSSQHSAQPMSPKRASGTKAARQCVALSSAMPCRPGLPHPLRTSR